MLNNSKISDTINDLIILRAIFVEELHKAVLAKDLVKVKEIAKIKCKKDIEINNELCDISGRIADKYSLDDIDIEICYNRLQEALKSDLSWAY